MAKQRDAFVVKYKPAGRRRWVTSTPTTYTLALKELRAKTAAGLEARIDVVPFGSPTWPTWWKR